MKDMKHDEKIEERFREYFDGNQTPACDLTHAKNAVLQERREKKKRQFRFLKFASAFACLVLIVSLGAVYLPSLFKRGDSSAEEKFIVYSLSQTTARAIGYDEAKTAYADETEIFSPFEWANNATLSYTLHEYETSAVLLCAELHYRSGMQMFDASVYIDLTNGAYEASEFDAYRAQENNEIVTEYLNGEYVSTARVVSGKTQYYAKVTSPQNDAAAFLVQQLIK